MSKGDGVAIVAGILGLSYVVGRIVEHFLEKERIENQARVHHEMLRTAENLEASASARQRATFRHAARVPGIAPTSTQAHFYAPAPNYARVSAPTPAHVQAPPAARGQMAPTPPVLQAAPSRYDTREDEIRRLFPFALPSESRLPEAISRLRDFQRGGHTRPEAQAKLRELIGGIPASRQVAGRWAHALELYRGLLKQYRSGAR